MMVDAGSENGAINEHEKEFIQNVFEFDDLTADEILTHRTDVVMLDVEDSMEIWKKTIFSTRHTLYPVCEGSADKVVGILNAKDYFRLEDKGIENIMQKAVFPAYFVPDTIKADDLFRNMKREKNTLAVVLDEYGGVTGIITINDLVEQLVGDLADDEEEEAILIENIEENTWKIHGSAELEDVSEILGVSLCSEEYDTFNGLIFHKLQSIPENGTNIELEFRGLKIKVIEIVNHQVETAIVEKCKTV